MALIFELLDFCFLTPHDFYYHKKIILVNFGHNNSFLHVPQKGEKSQTRVVLWFFLF